MIKCPKCGSTAIGHIRLDCDWGSGGDWTKSNTCGLYTDRDIKSFDDNERPDIDCNICCKCNLHFGELDGFDAEIIRLKNVISKINNILDHNEGESEQAICDVRKLCETELARLPNAEITGQGNDHA